MTKIKFPSICLLLASVAFIAACSDDDAGSEYTRQNTVSVERANLTFYADASQGSVLFSAPGTATATTTASWATAQVAGDSVVVSVTDNPNLESRSAMLTIRCGQDSTNVPILQNGCKFTYTGAKSFAIGDNDTTVALPFVKQGAQLTVTSSDSTALTSYEVGDTALTVGFAGNATGEIRQFDLYIEHAGLVDTVTVLQGEKSDLVGKVFYFDAYDLMLVDSTHTTYSQIEVTYVGYINEDEDGLYLYLPTQYNEDLTASMSIPLTLDPATLKLRVNGGQTVGRFTEDDYTFYMRTSIADDDVYTAFENWYAQNEDYDFFYLLNNSDLSMDAQLGVTSRGWLMGEFVDSGENDWFAQYLNQNLSSSISTTYNAVYLGVDVFYVSNRRWRYYYPLSLYAYPTLIHIPSSAAKQQQLSAAKPHRSVLGLPSLNGTVKKMAAKKRR